MNKKSRGKDFQNKEVTFMDYQEFLEYIKENIACMINEMEGSSETGDVEQGELYKVILHKVVKNNGIVLDGITLHKEGENITPNIYLTPYYESYRMGKPVSVIMEEILSVYQESKKQADFQLMDILDFKAVRDKIVIRLVNYERNKKQLEHCPFKKYLDLAVTFRLVAKKNTIGLASSLISNEEFRAWNIGLDELYRIALFNTVREFPWKLNSLTDVITDCIKQNVSDKMAGEIKKELEVLEGAEDRVDMYILTNDTGINGAACMLYDDVIKNFAKVKNSNVFILPSSVHELMLMPEQQNTDPQFLAEMVVEANQNAVGLIDLLSDNIYYYDRDRDDISMYAAE